MPTTGAPANRARASHGLPPGQRAVEGFPRFGTHLHRPPPPVPEHAVIAVGGTVVPEFAVPVTDLDRLPRHELVTDFHCVSGWSAVGLRWGGVSFRTFYEALVEPRLRPGSRPSHLVFVGLDRYRSVVEIDDALGPDVLIADRLGGRPLSGDHGAPLRLVSASQYGYVSTKHLCRIEVFDRAPRMKNPAAIRLGPVVLRTPLVKTHPRARVWQEERHPELPLWLVRPLYRAVIGPIRALSARGSRPDDPSRTLSEASTPEHQP